MRARSRVTWLTVSTVMEESLLPGPEETAAFNEQETGLVFVPVHQEAVRQRPTGARRMEGARRPVERT